MKTFFPVGVKEAADLMLSSDDVMIVCHTNPDGDAVGSALALKRIFELTGKTAKVVCPSEIPECVSFLCPDDVLYKEGDEEGCGKLIAVDVASPRQLGALARLAGRFDLMIDHHASGEAFAPYLTVPDASAAGEIVFDIYEELLLRGELSEDADVCRYLFAAISFDTGSFKYSNTTAKTFSVASRLTAVINGAADGGLATSDISRLIHDTVTEKDLRVAAFVAENMKLFCGGALAVCMITEEDKSALGVPDRDLGGAVDVARSLKGVLAAVTVRQNGQSYKISSRANADVDVASVCARFGGGGHIRAAGATLSAPSPEEALETVVEAFSAAVEKYKQTNGTAER